ncbi:MAG: hypothetical protein MJE66_07945 [Proteobacteria bacterium]|nr:hypothetical protein [Pseudomonadota bacterium]
MPAAGSANAYVNRVLSAAAVTQVFARASGSAGLKVGRMDCEKVRVAEGLPIDAFCWLELAAK